ncbi:MAG TPA: MBG domain-containing protein, partial [Terracidiphilus sp.]
MSFKDRNLSPTRVWKPLRRSGKTTRILLFLPLMMLAGFAWTQQTFPPPAVSSTPIWGQNFSGFKTGVVWPDIDGDKIKQDGGALIATCPAGISTTNCFQVIYNIDGGWSTTTGIVKAVPSNPVLVAPIPGSPDCDAAGTASAGLPCIGWSPAGVPPDNFESVYTTNTSTDVVQNDIVINPSINGTKKDPISESATPYANPPSPNYAYTLTYDVYFAPGFDFAKGGKLPGLGADDFDSGCTDDGSIKRTPNRWSERVMWRENGRVELYSYDQSRPSGNCGIDELVSAAAGDPAYEYPNAVPGDGKFRFQTGIWYQITISVAVNANNAVVYATDGSGNTLLDAFGDPIVIGANGPEGGLVYLGITNLSTNTLEGTIQYNNVALRDECDLQGSGTYWQGSAPLCASPVPDSIDARVNTLFFSTFFGGNETKRLTCLNDSIPGGTPTGITQAIYEELCASQRVEYIWPTNTWLPQTPSQAYFANLNVYPGYTGLPGTPPSWGSGTTLSATPISETEIDLSWTAAAAGTGSSGSDPIAGYKVYSNGGILLGQTSTTSFQVTNIAGTQLVASTPYYFFVKAYSQSGNQSEFSNEAYAVTTSTPSSVILPPGSVTSNTLPDGTNIVLWAPQPTAASYQILRNGVPIPGAAKAVLPVTQGCGALPAQQTYVDNGTDIGGLVSGTQYTYTLTATDGSGNVSGQSLPTTTSPQKAVTSNIVLAVTPPYCQVVSPGSGTSYNLFVSDPNATLAVVADNPYSTSATSTALEFGALYSALPVGVSVSFGSVGVNGMGTMTVTTTASTPPGIYPINITAKSTKVPNPLWAQFELVVGAGPTSVTVTANNETMLQGSAVPPLTYTVSPSVALTTAPTCTTTGTSSSPAGNYPITCSGAAGAGDTFTYNNGTLTITSSPVQVTVTASSGTMAYGS